MLKTCRIRVVDGHPAHTRYTCVGDVPGSVEISMEFKSTVPASEVRSLAVPLVDMPAPGAFLRGIPGVYEDHALACGFRLVPDELFKLIERPVAQFPVEFLAPPALHAYLAQVFESKHRVPGVNYLFRDAVVGISHKPSFPSAYLAHLALCGSGAFGLKFCPDVFVPIADVTNSPRVEEGIVGTDRDVFNPTVYPEDTPAFDPEDTPTFDRMRSLRFHLNVQEKLLCPAIVRENGALDRPSIYVPSVAAGGDKFCANSSSGCCNGSKPVEQAHPDDSLVVSNRRERLSFRKTSTLRRFQSVARAIARSLNKRRWEIRYRSPNDPVRGGVVPDLVAGMVVKPPTSRRVECDSVRSHRVQHQRHRTPWQPEFNSYRAYHTHMLNVMQEKDFETSPEVKECASSPV